MYKTCIKLDVTLILCLAEYNRHIQHWFRFKLQ